MASSVDMKELVATRDVPYCTICLVICVFVCHTLVLVGNFTTADGFVSIGSSTGGWSGVGLGISKSLNNDLNMVMKNLTGQLTDAINRTLVCQNLFDLVLGLAGGTLGKVSASSSTHALLLLQSHGIITSDGLPDMITNSLDTVMDNLMKKALDLVDMLLKKLKPALLQAGKFIVQFGEKVQQIIEAFSITLDRVQKIFDQVMHSLAHTKGKQAMVHNTFTIFDFDADGEVSALDMQKVAKLYTVPAIQGVKANDLVDKYDEDKSGGLNHDEYELFVDDSTVPHIMSVVLRAFAKTLSEVAGKVGGSKFRGEIAEDVVSYFDLMAAKNHTKVGWVSDALGNGSLPLAFTADVLVEMALALDNPNTFKDLKTGEKVVAEMVRLHPNHTADAVDLISNSTYWVSEGFHPDDHGVVISRVTGWMTKAQAAIAKTGLMGEDDAGDADADEFFMVEKDVLDRMPEIARNMVEKSTRAHVHQKEDEWQQRYDLIFESEHSRNLLVQLTGGEYASDSSHASSSEATRLIKQGVPAKPETLQFAKWLSYNATRTADTFQKLTFHATATSSNAIDSFATQIQAMVKKIQGFIKMMIQFCTPKNILKIENKFQNFAHHAANDILKIVKHKVGDVINQSVPVLEHSLHSAIDDAGMALGKTIASALTTPFGKALAPAFSAILGGILGKSTKHDVATGALGSQLAKILTGQIDGIVGSMLGKEIANILQGLVNQGLMTAGKFVNSTLGDVAGLTSLLQMPTSKVFDHKQVMEDAGHSDIALLADLDSKVSSALRRAQVVLQDAMEQALEARRLGQANQASSIDLAQTDLAVSAETSGIWSEMIQTLRSVTNIMPLATKTLTFARKEVCMLAKNLDSIFVTFQDHGPPIFDDISSLWSTIWTLYYFVVIPFPLVLLFYAFWAGGFFGGPGTLPEKQDEAQLEPVQPATFWDKCQNCCTVCCNCLCGYHDTTFCFWSLCIMLQIGVLILFIISIVFCLLAAIKLFLAAGCAQIYILGDEAVCGNTLLNLRTFLKTFLPGVNPSTFPLRCTKEQLLACDLLGNKMKESGMLTTIGSFLAAIFSFQMLIESATLHTRAVERRKIVAEMVKEY